jgi:squalene-hopene/tetraprenyl-beta-curcumene cyclase
MSESTLAAAIAASQDYLLSLQYPEGYWWAELESNVTITAEVVLLHKIWGTDQTRPLAKAETYLRAQQREHGGWELYYGDGGDLSTSIEAYMALRLLGVPASDPALQRGRDLILKQGGVSKSRIFTKLHLALLGCFPWQGIPSLPPWIMFFAPPFPFSIYEMSSWARGSTVPLLIVLDRKPVFKMDPAISLEELYTEGDAQAHIDLPAQNDWTDIFLYLDQAFKWAEDLDLVPFRDEGLQAAEKWILERQEATGDWAGIIPAMLNSLLALRCLEYVVTDPVVVRGIEAVDRFALETDTEYWVQPCISPVWDTAWALRALVESGLDRDHSALTQGGEWLLRKQILDYGDWILKNPHGKPGGWAFEFDNRFYPDVDDTAVVVMALQQLHLPNEAQKRSAVERATDWISSMQCQAGGWAAFDINNDQDWLNAIPYGDLKAMIDPNTADVTARVLEMVGYLQPGTGSLPKSQVEDALTYLYGEQEPEGCWFGRWGVNYIYGTSGALSALAQVAPQAAAPQIQKGAAWLLSCQNKDGGWGESCRSYEDPNLKGKGESTASQTAWALIGLMAAAEATGTSFDPSLQRGIDYLLKTQQSDGTWDEAEFTGTGFPRHFYLKYHLYQQYFPLMALGRYQAMSHKI